MGWVDSNEMDIIRAETLRANLGGFSKH